MQRITVTITEAEQGRRIRSILKGRLGFSSHAIASLTRTETGILLNGNRAFSSASVQAGDVLSVDIGDRRSPDPHVIPCAVPLPVIWEDPYLLVASKPAGMVSLTSSFRPETPTVAGALAYQRGNTAVFHVVNRLDKGTTGLMVVAKSGYVHNLLRRQLHSPDFYREYRGICLGHPVPDSGIIRLPIGRDENSTVARKIRLDGADSVTRYQVLSQTSRFSLLKLVPETGRTHQLRLHLSAIGHPLAGDWLYGTEDPNLIARPALHSCTLHLRHPVTGEMLDLNAPIPADMERLLTL